MSNSDIRFYEFGEFRLDTRRRTLLKSGEPQPLSGRLFDLLLVLIQNEGRILDHDELLDKVWEGAFVEQSNLKKAVSSLRQILGEQPNQSLYVKTIPRRGYSFVSPVTAVSDGETATAVYREREIIVEEIEEVDDEPVALPQAAVEKKSFSKTLVLAGLAVIALVAVAVGAWFYLARQPNRFSVENVRITKLTTEGNAAYPVVSSDGNYIVYASEDPQGSHLQLKQLLTGTTKALITLPRASYWAIAFSPDANFIYFFAKNWLEPAKSGLYKVSFLGGEARLISKEAGGGLTVSPDGNTLAMARDSVNREPQIIVMDSEGGNERAIASYKEQIRIWSLGFSPDGKTLLTSFRNQVSADKTKYYMSEISLADGSERALIPDNPTLMQSAAWMPDGQSVMLTMRQPNADITQVWQYFPSGGEMKRVTNDDNSYRSLKISSDGKTIFSTIETRISGIWTGAQDNLNNFKLITNGVQMMDRVLWTGDGRLIYSGTENGVEAIWIMAADGSGKKMLTDGKDGIWLQPTVSGDGNSAVYLSSRSGTAQIWKIGFDGQNLTQLTSSDTPVSIAQLLSDGQTLFYQAYQRPLGWVIMKRAADGSVSPVTDREAEHWSVSPDEKMIAFGANDPDTSKEMIYVKSLETGSIIKSIPGSSDKTLIWTRDSKAILFNAKVNSSGEIMMLPLDAAEAKPLTDFRSDHIFWFDVSRDGKAYATVRGKQPNDIVMIREEKR